MNPAVVEVANANCPGYVVDKALICVPVPTNTVF